MRTQAFISKDIHLNLPFGEIISRVEFKVLWKEVIVWRRMPRIVEGVWRYEAVVHLCSCLAIVTLVDFPAAGTV